MSGRARSLTGSAGTALLASAAFAACGGPYSTFRPGGPEAAAVATISWWISGFMVLVTLIMAGLVLVGALRRRGTLAEHLPVDAPDDKRWIIFGGIGVPVLVLTILFLLTVGTLRHIPSATDDVDLDVEVIGHQWWWEIRYLDPDHERRFTTANELHIPVGAKVRVTLKSVDVIHSFWVPRLHGKLDLIPNHTNRLVLQAGEPGVYRGECAEYCGTQHANMRFLVIAEPPEQFAAWVNRQEQPAHTSTSPQLVRGRHAFEEYACGLCHTIRGTRARGQVAPDLTHFGSRQTIAAGTLPNTRARLQAWIVNAQSLKPGTRMPSLSTFDSETLNAITAYLASLQ